MSKTKLLTQNKRPSAATPRSFEDYLEAVLRLEQAQGVARVSDLAAVLRLHKSTVATTLKTLAARGLITHTRYAAARMTPAGAEIAARVTARHVLIRDYLTHMLLLDASVADANACRMEHILDVNAVARLEDVARFTARHPRVAANWHKAFHSFLAHRPATRGKAAGGGSR